VPFLSLKVKSLKFVVRLFKAGRLLLTREEARRLFRVSPKTYKYTLWTKLKFCACSTRWLTQFVAFDLYWFLYSDSWKRNGTRKTALTLNKVWKSMWLINLKKTNAKIDQLTFKTDKRITFNHNKRHQSRQHSLHRLVSNYQLNAQFLYSITIYTLHYNPQHVSSCTMLIFRRTNCIITASGIVTLCKRPYSMPVESGMQSALNRHTVSL